MRAALHAAAGVLLTLTVAACGLAGGAPAPPAPTSADLRGVEDGLVARLQESRATASLPALTRDDGLDGLARRWSETMAADGELRHNPRYQEQIRGQWTSAGENVARADTTYAAEDLAELVHAGWMDSPTHRANLDSESYTHVGVGVAYDAEHGWFVTQDFAAYVER